MFDYPVLVAMLWLLVFHAALFFIFTLIATNMRERKEYKKWKNDPYGIFEK